MWDTDVEAMDELAHHYLEKHPEIAIERPVVQLMARRVAAEVAPTNGAMTRNE